MVLNVLDKYLSVAKRKGFAHLWGTFYAVHMFAILVSVAGETLLRALGLYVQRNSTGVAFTSGKFEPAAALYLVGMSVVILPAIEEVIYRLPLAGGRQLKSTSIFAIAAVSLLALGWFDNSIALYTTVAGVVLGYYLWNYDLRVTSCRPLTSVDKAYIILFSIVFALDHLGANKQLGFSIQAVLALLPFFASGLMSGLISFRYGVLYTLGLHVTWNSLQMLFSLLTFVAPGFGMWVVLLVKVVQVVIALIAACLFFSVSKEV